MKVLAFFTLAAYIKLNLMPEFVEELKKKNILWRYSVILPKCKKQLRTERTRQTEVVQSK